MGRFARKYSEEQRHAIAAAMLDRDMTGKQTAEAAAGGTLVDGLEPFTVPVQTTYTIASGERERRDEERWAELLRRDPAAALEEIDQRLVRVLMREGERLKRASEDGTLRIGELAAFGRARRQFAMAGLIRIDQSAPTPHPDPEENTDDALDELTAELDAEPDQLDHHEH